MTTETKQKKMPIAHLTYLPYKEKGVYNRVGPIFATKREDCKSLLVENIPVRLIQDINEGNLGSFFIYDQKDKEESA